MDGIRFVNEARVVLEREKAMRESHWNVDDMTIHLRELIRRGLSEGGGVFAEIEDDIKHATGNAVDEFLVGMGRHLEVHSPQDTDAGRGEELLANGEVDAMLREITFVERLHEIAVGTLRNEGAEDFHAG